MADDSEDDNGAVDYLRVDPDIRVLAERQRNVLRRLNRLEQRQNEIDVMMNRGIGGAVLLIGLGVFVGWLFAVGSNVLHIFR